MTDTNNSDFTTLANPLTGRAQMAADRREAVARRASDYYVHTTPATTIWHGRHKPYGGYYDTIER